MVKTTTTIRIDVHLHELAMKQKKGFLSNFIDEQLKNYFEIKKEDLEHLKTIERIEEELNRENAKLSILKEKKKLIEEELEQKQQKKLNEESKWKDWKSSIE